MQAEEDAFGRLLLDYLEGRPGLEILERDDGFIAIGSGPGAYFEPARRWPKAERKALRWVRGRVLDVGAGAGRVALELERRGHEVVAIDSSPLAVEVARRRGVRDVRLLRLEDVDGRVGRIDTVLMLGNNFGVLGDADKARHVLRRLHEATSELGRIVAATSDPYGTRDPDHLAYHERNREQGRLGGQIRMRIRHRTLASGWFDYLNVSRDELRELAAESGWRPVEVIDGEGPRYVAVLDKDG